VFAVEQMQTVDEPSVESKDAREAVGRPPVEEPEGLMHALGVEHRAKVANGRRVFFGRLGDGQALDDVKERLAVVGLRDVGRERRLCSQALVSLEGVRGDGDGGGASQRRIAPYGLEEVVPVHLGHRDVEQHDIGLPRREEIEGLTRARRDPHGRPLRLDVETEQLGIVGLVIDEENGNSSEGLSHSGLCWLHGTEVGRNRGLQMR
jgi:hypothetical protein